MQDLIPWWSLFLGRARINTGQSVRLQGKLEYNRLYAVNLGPTYAPTGNESGGRRGSWYKCQREKSFLELKDRSVTCVSCCSEAKLAKAIAVYAYLGGH